MNELADDTQLYLIGFRIEPDVYDPQIYTIYVDGDRPILFERRAIIFPRPELAAAALAKSDCGAARFGPAPTEVSVVFDVTQALFSLDELDVDVRAEILDLINILLDFRNCMGEPAPAGYVAILSDLADHLTFSKDIAAHFAAGTVTRREATDAIYWFLGMIAYKSYHLIE